MSDIKVNGKWSYSKKENSISNELNDGRVRIFDFNKEATYFKLKGGNVKQPAGSFNEVSSVDLNEAKKHLESFLKV